MVGTGRKARLHAALKGVLRKGPQTEHNFFPPPGRTRAQAMKDYWAALPADVKAERIRKLHIARLASIAAKHSSEAEWNAMKAARRVRAPRARRTAAPPLPKGFAVTGPRRRK